MFGTGVRAGGGAVVDYVPGADEVVPNPCSWLVSPDRVARVPVVADDGDERGPDVPK